MKRIGTLVAGAAVLAALAPIGTAGAAGVSGGRLFTSKRYGYSLRLPSGWGANRVPGAWNGSIGPGSAGSDNFISPSLDLQMTVIGRKTGSLTLARWTREVARSLAVHCPHHARATHSSLGGSPATSVVYRCSDGRVVRMLTVLHGGHAIVVGAGSPSATSRRDQATAKRLLATWRFTR